MSNEKFEKFEELPSEFITEELVSLFLEANKNNKQIKKHTTSKGYYRKDFKDFCLAYYNEEMDDLEEEEIKEAIETVKETETDDESNETDDLITEGIQDQLNEMYKSSPKVGIRSDNNTHALEVLATKNISMRVFKRYSQEPIKAIRLDILTAKNKPIHVKSSNIDQLVEFSKSFQAIEKKQLKAVLTAFGTALFYSVGRKSRTLGQIDISSFLDVIEILTEKESVIRKLLANIDYNNKQRGYVRKATKATKTEMMKKLTL